jgi:polyribonucleotide nucleotidyltransferase
LNLVVAGTLDAITMVEAGAKEVSDEEMVKSLEKAHEIIKEICKAESDFVEEYRKMFGIPKVKAVYNSPNEELYDVVGEYLTDKKLEVLYNK